jgi:hypothetical protein
MKLNAPRAPIAGPLNSFVLSLRGMARFTDQVRAYRALRAGVSDEEVANTIFKRMKQRDKTWMHAFDIALYGRK